MVNMKVITLSLIALLIAISTKGSPVDPALVHGADTIPVPAGLSEFEQKVWLDVFDLNLNVASRNNWSFDGIVSRTNGWFESNKSSLPTTQ
jgi:hypothetical protein